MLVWKEGLRREPLLFLSEASEALALGEGSDVAYMVVCKLK